MSITVHFVHVDATLREAVLLFQKHRIGSLLVKGDEQFMGSITEKELSREVVAGEIDPFTTRVMTCMREPIITIESRDPMVDGRPTHERESNPSFGSGGAGNDCGCHLGL